MTTDPGTAPTDDAKKRFQDAAADRLATVPPASAERSLWQGGYSAKAMYGTWLLCAVITVVGIVALVFTAPAAALAWPIGGGVIVLLWVWALGVYLVRRLSVHYELTTQRFIHQEGIIVRKTNRIEVLDIDDVAFTQGIVQRMLGVGQIQLTSSDKSHPLLKLDGIDQVATVSNMIDDIRRDERRRRSLHIEA
ncbi:MAG: PH domain-containing protein [Pirellulales bacterium]